ncbi:hypothetical protein R5O20_03760 [Tenacibaculum maritimum]|uniref:hypothetical protein n=1 Tax=Tenacibaculum maritimum TaxID=107401 RepID=UPI00388FB409
MFHKNSSKIKTVAIANDNLQRGGIDSGKNFRLVTANTVKNRVNKEGSRFPFTVFDREIKQLEAAGYKQKGNWMISP